VVLAPSGRARRLDHIRKRLHGHALLFRGPLSAYAFRDDRNVGHDGVSGQ
jgi:hypothetical protein